MKKDKQLIEINGKESLKSTNGITGVEYRIPDLLDDKEDIDRFLAVNKGKPVVVVQGLGFVGAVMTLICANALQTEYAVIGVDLATADSYWKIKSINEGIFPVVASDPKIETFYKKAMEKGNLFATYDPYAFEVADVIIIDINLDVQKNTDDLHNLLDFAVDLSPFKKAVCSIGNRCKEDVLILVETTVPPGTTQKIVKPLIDVCLSERRLSIHHYKLGHSYERVMPGPDYIDSIQNFYRVFSGVDAKSTQAVEKFLKTIISTATYPLTRLGTTTATEMAKVLENSYRAMNIAFVQEWCRFAEGAGVNMYEVVNAIRLRPTHANLMYPGLGVGGYCLTKDPLLASWAWQNLFADGMPLLQSEEGVKLNDQMPVYAFNFLQRYYLKSLKGKKAALLGVSYRSDVGDTRYTPVEAFYNCLQREGMEIILHDPFVKTWEEKRLPVEQDIVAVLSKTPDIVAITTAHREYKNNTSLMDLLLDLTPVFILDTVGVLNDSEIKKLAVKHKIKILGRGDI
jgi:nucleotide sugar dehydrogenase